MKQRLLWASGGAILIVGCAVMPRSDTATSEQYQRDRQAILAMAGEFHVTFDFEESTALAEGYELREPQRSTATEIVTVLEDSPRRIVLQHILVLGDDQRVVKHWRQDWVRQPREVFQYLGERRWQLRSRSPEEVRGAWSQSVWQVDDSPRYAAIGRWRHDGNQSVWTSETTWRPLPRREHTTRDDYDVMLAVNRHVITPFGWLHEQDNAKLVTRDDQYRLLAREYGRNRYQRIDDYDFTPAFEYWDRTEDYWAEVRRRWEALFADRGEVALVEKVDDENLWERMFRLADESPDPAAVRPALYDFLTD